MGYKDADKQREYAREWAAKQRKKASAGKNKIELSEDFNFKLETAHDLTLVIETVINEVLQAKMEAAVRGRCIAQLVQTAIKLLEVGEVEDRIAKRESR
jgi:hypothetical protein